MMAFIRNSLVIVFSLALLMGASTASARYSDEVGAQAGQGGVRPSNGYGNNEERVRVLETRVGQLEYSLYQINQRLAALETSQRPQPYPTQPQEMACMVVDSLVYRASLGKGRTKLEAEANARQACASSVHSSYCQTAAKCSDERDLQVRQGVMCVLKDTLVSRTYKGEAKTFVEAEYQARKVCAESVHGSYCRAEVRCEAF
ncbi:hypothetical protein [Bdellovibrio svalbardensis]|uniref:DUF4189 domain-containing protein n=1 Tax=Bdellovibrio svalbardensis TaxID=2972972 RepID=A0ABT6DGS9_9BACT|nr:hypothetical protein [Bdellovibrio svalbardensis]MDG0816045.1 hypothetical protein [Bdellovibrio svalbardensis]